MGDPAGCRVDDVAGDLTDAAGAAAAEIDGAVVCECSAAVADMEGAWIGLVHCLEGDGAVVGKELGHVHVDIEELVTEYVDGGIAGDDVERRVGRKIGGK